MTVPGKILDVHQHSSIIVTVGLNGDTNSDALLISLSLSIYSFFTWWLLIACSLSISVRGEHRAILLGLP